jgi:hypothetical protein
MVERDEAKGMAIKSGSPTDWQTYCKLRNHVTKLDLKKKLHYEININYIKNDIKKLWGTLNYIFWGKKPTLLHLLNGAHSSQSPLILQTTLMTFSISIS